MSKFKSLKTSATLLTKPRTLSAATIPAATKFRTAAAAQQQQQRFTTTATPSRSSPFKSFITTGLRGVRRSNSDTHDFAYDLSKDELRFMSSNRFKSAMKAVPDGERQLLKTGQRAAYLEQRYEHSPVHKYNYPVATSWRIGWLHNQQRSQETSAATAAERLCFAVR